MQVDYRSMWRSIQSTNCTKWLRLALLLPGLFLAHNLSAQIATGHVTGKIRDVGGEALNVAIAISAAPNYRSTTHTDARGTFSLTLPYGRYHLDIQFPRSSLSTSVPIDVEPLQNQNIVIIVDSSGQIRLENEPAENAGIGAARPEEDRYPEAFNFSGIMLEREAATAALPLNFTGLGDNRLGWQSQRGFSWTGTQFKLMGMDATDSFQPGRPVVLPNVDSLDELVTRSGFAQTTSSAYATETGFFPEQPNSSWHGGAYTSDTSAALASSNLPAADRGPVRQNEEFRWFTRNIAKVGGPLTRWADLFIAAGGQWSSQTIPIAGPGNDLDSRILFAGSRLRFQAGARDQFDLIYSGSRLDLFNWGMPAGLELLSGRRMAPSFVLPFGFQNEREADQFNFLQAGWSHIAPDTMVGALEARYQYSVAHLDTTPLSGLSRSRIELLDGGVTGAPPLANAASEIRQQVNAFWQPAVFNSANLRHQPVIGAGFETSSPTNRLTIPSDLNLITAAGVPAFVVEFNTPAYSRSILRSITLTAADHILVRDTLSFEFGVVADFARGSLPAQSSPAGIFFPARSVPSNGDLIAWNGISPRAGFAWAVPHSSGVVLRGSYFRVYMPLAGRYFDFSNPSSLGGSEFQWADKNSDGMFEPGELGPLLLRFGGPFSSISPALARPYADEFDVGAEMNPTRALALRLALFRRDDKRRIAAINTGVPFSAFSPVSILDPGPDNIPGTFDDQHLTVYEQNPSTFGQDFYLLTTPPDLRMLDKGVQAEVRAEWQKLFLSTSFVAEQSYGPTNPGDAAFENDPGVVGALYADPNTLVNASGRPVMDRAFLGKVQAMYRLPFGIEFAAIVDYLDGLVFARQLLVTGLSQGPVVVDATSRGTQVNNPLSGNRAEGVINGNLRLAKQFRLPAGSVGVALDLLNVANSGYKVQENAISGTSFNLRLPVEIQPARFARFELRYSF
jgi:hypothetical protein